MSPRMQTASDAWGAPLPEWIGALADACDATSQNKVAQRIGYSGAVVSNVLRNRYPGDLKAVETRVRAELMREEVACHALGVIALKECLEHQSNAEAFGSPNPLKVRMRRACNQCPVFKERSKP